jgi:hypothetical protein
VFNHRAWENLTISFVIFKCNPGFSFDKASGQGEPFKVSAFSNRCIVPELTNNLGGFSVSWRISKRYGIKERELKQRKVERVS